MPLSDIGFIFREKIGIYMSSNNRYSFMCRTMVCYLLATDLGHKNKTYYRQSFECRHLRRLSTSPSHPWLVHFNKYFDSDFNLSQIFIFLSGHPLKNLKGMCAVALDYWK